MKNALLITLFSLTLTSFSYSQILTTDWAIQNEGLGSFDYGNGIHIDTNGNVYSVGSFQGYTDFDPGAAVLGFNTAGGNDIFIQKLDSLGNLIWIYTFGSTGSDVATDVVIDSLGFLFVIGSFSGTIDFDPGIGIANLSSASSNTDFFILKLDIDGNFIWVKKIGGSAGESGQRIKIDNDGELVIIGTFSSSNVDFDPGSGTSTKSTIGNADLFILKLNSSGNFIWVQTIGGAYFDYPEDLAFDAQNNLVIVGTFEGTVDFDPGAGINNHYAQSTINPDGFILKLSSLGNYMWSKDRGNASDSEGTYAVAIDESSQIYIGTQFRNTISTESQSFVAIGSADLLIEKFDSLGNVIWQIQKGGNSGILIRQIDIDNSGNLVCLGTFSGTSDFDLSSSAGELITNGGSDIFIMKMSDSGAFIWCRSIGGIEYDYIGSQFIDENNNLFIIGYFGNTVDFDPEAGILNLTSAYALDIFVAKYSICSDAYSADVVLLNDIIDPCSVASITPPTASNSCGSIVTATTNISFPITSSGTTVVTWVYDYGNGNTFTQTQNVIINDAVTPVADITSLPNVTSECPVTSLTAPTATDNCIGTVTGTHNATLPITTQGTTTVTWSYNDGNGNTSTQTQDVIITPIDNGITQVDPITLMANATGYNYQWLDCDNANAPVSGATSQTFVPAVAGNYACEISNGTCTVTTSCLASSLAINENSFGSSLVIYPNPTSGDLKINLGEKYNGIIVNIHNSIGELVLHKKVASSNLIELNIEGAPGLYTLNIQTTNGKTATIRIVKR